MPTIHIVTDSAAHFASAHNVHQGQITVVPNTIIIGGRAYREGIDIGAEDALRLIASSTSVATVVPPSEKDFLQVYASLAHHHDAIVSLHASREILPTWHKARSAAQQMLGHCQIEVIDSQTISVGQAMLARVAAQAAEQESDFEAVVRAVRSAIERCYSVYLVESMDYLLKNQIMPASQAILGTLMGIKPFLTIEEGRLIPMEKVRTRVQALERLVEYAVEFTDIEDMVIVQNKAYITEQTRMLQDRLLTEFPGRHFPYALYGPSLAALIGADAAGLVVLEQETTGDEDDF